MPTALEVAQAYREQLLKQDAASMDRLIRAYRTSFDMLKYQLESLVMEASENGWTAGQLQRAGRYKALMAQIADELRDLQGLTKSEIYKVTDLNIKMGLEQANGLMAAVAGDQNLAVMFNKLNPEAVKSLIGFLSPDSPLYQRLGELSAVSTERIANDFVNGITAGWNPKKIAQVFLQDWGISLTDAMRMTRTAGLWAYREANRASFVANRDVLDGWIWCADLSPRTCAACIAMDGSIHPDTETLNDHHNGRCSMVPIVKGFPPVIEQGRGEAWFNKQPESVQKEMLGPGKYEAWKDGKFNFTDLVSTKTDKVYGEMKRETTLKELIGDGE